MKYYTREEVADILGVTTRTVYNYMKSGELVGYEIGGSWRFKAEDIEKFVTRKSSLDKYGKKEEV